MVQDDMSKAHSVDKDWEFVSKGLEISLGRFVSEHFAPLISRHKDRTSGGDSTVIEVGEVEKSF